eukprot:5684526-Prymnesium_polylepis.1
MARPPPMPARPLFAHAGALCPPWRRWRALVGVPLPCRPLVAAHENVVHERRPRSIVHLRRGRRGPTPPGVEGRASRTRRGALDGCARGGGSATRRERATHARECACGACVGHLRRDCGQHPPQQRRQLLPVELARAVGVGGREHLARLGLHLDRVHLVQRLLHKLCAHLLAREAPPVKVLKLVPRERAVVILVE